MGWPRSLPHWIQFSRSTFGSRPFACMSVCLPHCPCGCVCPSNSLSVVSLHSSGRLADFGRLALTCSILFSLSFHFISFPFEEELERQRALSLSFSAHVPLPHHLTACERNGRWTGPKNFKRINSGDEKTKEPQAKCACGADLLTLL